jgi:hypothetical protein
MWGENGVLDGFHPSVPPSFSLSKKISKCTNKYRRPGLPFNGTGLLVYYFFTSVNLYTLGAYF